MLNPNAQLWVDALRSGDYKQGRYTLTEVRPDGEFDCCLGVACKVAIANGVSVETKQARHPSSTTTLHPFITYGGHQGALVPDSVAKWLGAASSRELASLAPLNDSGSYNFSAIARHIERNAETLFA